MLFTEHSRDCQRKDWQQGHKPECAATVQLRARGWPLPRAVLRLAARIMRMMASDGGALCKQLSELRHHLSDRSAEQRSEMHVAAKKLLTLLLLSQKQGSQLPPHSCSVEAAEELLGRVDCNCFT
jgi:hypothetical protein